MRTRRLAAILLIAALAVLLLSPGVTAAPDSAGGEIDVLVGFHSRMGVAQMQHQVRQLGGEVRVQFNIVDAMAARMPPAAAEALARHPAVRYVEPDGPVHTLGVMVASGTQTVPWGIERVFADEEYPFDTWDSATGQGVGVAVIDTGIDENHEDLPPLAGGTNTVDGTHWGQDDYGHGTHVAGTISALDNDVGVVGVAPGAALYSVKALDETGSGYISDIVSGIEWSVEQGIPIMNMSLGTTANYLTLQEACQNAYGAGHLLVAAAGNVENGSDGDDVFYPAAYPSVMAVSASDSSDLLAGFSSTGPEVELIGPGVEVESTVPVLPESAQLEVAATNYVAQAVPGSGCDAVSAVLVDCGLALDEDSCDPPEGDWIALIDRGEITFAEKVRNVMEQGATAAIIANNDEENPDDPGSFTLYVTDEDKEYDWIPTVSVSYNSGHAIRDAELGEGMVTVECGEPYDSYQGTSMAAPHVAGAAALAWAANTYLSNVQLREVVRDTAEDLGLDDIEQGHGLVWADRAVAEALTLLPGHIEGTVTDADDGAPIESASVVVEGADLSAETDSDGRYLLEDVPVGSYDVTASAEGYYSQTVEGVQVEADATATVNFALQIIPQDILTVEEPQGQGTVTPEVGQHSYPEGTEVELTAEPDTGWEFDFWNGDVAEPCRSETTIIMESDETVQAVFREKYAAVFRGDVVVVGMDTSFTGCLFEGAITVEKGAEGSEFYSSHFALRTPAEVTINESTKFESVRWNPCASVVVGEGVTLTLAGAIENYSDELMVRGTLDTSGVTEFANPVGVYDVSMGNLQKDESDQALDLTFQLPNPLQGGQTVTVNLGKPLTLADSGGEPLLEEGSANNWELESEAGAGQVEEGNVSIVVSEGDLEVTDAIVTLHVQPGEVLSAGSYRLVHDDDGNKGVKQTEDADSEQQVQVTVFDILAEDSFRIGNP